MNTKPRHSKEVKTIGAISDTHGLLRPEVLNALQGVDVIFHAGDIGGAEILEELEEIAPVLVVKGNCDHNGWSNSLPSRQLTKVGGIHFYLLHDLYLLDLDPGAAEVSVVISGHTHQPKIATIDHILFLNPGSAGPRRFDYPISIAKITLQNQAIHPELIQLNIPKI